MAASSTNPQSSSSTHHQHSFLPVYQSLATVNVGNFVTVKLSGDMKSNNYSLWKLQVLSLIESHDLLSFIDGSTRPPHKPQTGATTAGGDYDLWRTDKVLRGWILGTISEHTLLESVAELATAGEVWLALERRFKEKADEPIVTGQDLFNVHIPLIKAALTGDWGAAQPILNNYPGAGKASIAGTKVLTQLEAAVGTGKDIHYVNKLLEYIHDDELVGLKNDAGSTALHIASAVGNRAAAIVLVDRMPSLCYISDDSGDFPIQCAAKYAKKEMLQYLIGVTQDNMNPNPYAGVVGLRLLTYTIDADFFDIALSLVEKYPYLAWVKSPSGDSALVHLIGRTALSYKRRPFFNSFYRLGGGPMATRLILLPVRPTNHDSSNRNLALDFLVRGFQNWKALVKAEPAQGNYMNSSMSQSEMKRMKEQALELVKLLCYHFRSLDDFHKARDIYENAILKAAELGVRDVVEAIVDIIPLSIYACQMPSRQNIFHVAVENRSEDVFNLIYLMSDHKYLFSNITDVEGNNLLHLAGKLAPVHKLNEILNPTLQMLRELQWFEEVKRLVHPSAREQKNLAGKTPAMVFTEEHKNLREAGEKWLKDIANAGTISTALIITVMFAVAITVPGGNKDETGLPTFSKNPFFIVFAVSDAISLLASTASFMIFLGILVSRYAEEDFGYILPSKLILGLDILFLSLSWMLVSFTTALYLVFGQDKQWIQMLILVLAVCSALISMRFQVSFVADLAYLFFGLKIVWKKSDRPFF